MPGYYIPSEFLFMLHDDDDDEDRLRLPPRESMEAGMAADSR